MAAITVLGILITLVLPAQDGSAYELFSIGCQFELDGEVEQAIRYYKEALLQDPGAGQVYIALANALYKTGDYDEGMRWARGALDTSFDTTRIYYTIASGYIGKRDFRGALPYYERLLARDSTNTDLYTSISMLYEGLEELAEARAVMSAVPDSLRTVDVYMRLGMLAGKMSDHSAALRYYRDAHLADSTDVSALIGIGTAFDVINVKDSAILYYEQAFRSDTLQMSVGKRLVELYTDTDRYAQVVRLAPELLQREYHDTNTRRNLGFALYKSGRPQEALEQFMITSRIDPDDAYSRFYAAKIYLDVALYEKAREEIERALRIAPDFVELWVYLCFIGIDTRDFETAQYALTEATHRGGDVVQLYYLFGALAEMQEEYEDAYAYYGKALHEDGENIAALEALASLCETMGRSREALTYFTRIISLDSLNAPALNYVGYTYAEKNDSLDYALDLIQRALEIEEDNAYFMDSRGWVYYRMGLYDKAREDLEHAAHLVDDAVILQHLGDVHRELGAIEQALQTYRRALEQDPDNNEIKNKIREILTGRE